MAKQIRISTMLLAIAIAFTACTFEEPELFEKSAAERIILAKERYRQALIASPNGWVMDYFPTVEQKGYAFSVKFNENTSAVFAAKNELTGNKYETDTCVFEMISDNGPVLTFNLAGGNTSVSKVGIFHVFTNPEGGYYGQGMGYGGDYEFMTIDETPEKILLKGKKRGVYIELRRLPEKQDWKEYFTVLEQMDAALFHPKLPVTLTLKTKDGNYPYFLTNGISHIFTAKTQSEIDAKKQGRNIPFIITDFGLRLAQPFNIGSNTVQTFRLADDKSKLICMDENVQAEIAGEDLLSTFFRPLPIFWVFDRSNVSGRVAELCDKIETSCIAEYQAEKVQIGIAYTLNRSTYDLRVLFERNAGRQTLTGNLYLSASQEASGSVSFRATGAGDNNGNIFSTRIEGFKDLAELVSKSFSLSTDTPISPVKIKFMQVGGTEVWFLAACQ